jgi:quercetin dioxygenase-like cupin family protein
MGSGSSSVVVRSTSPGCETSRGGATGTHHVGRVDWSFAERPVTGNPTSSGLSRSVLVGPAQGAAHTELAAGSLAPGGWLARHVHSFEEALYILEGILIFESDGHVHRLLPGDYALNPIGVPHTLAAGDRGVRWLSVNTPPRRPPDAAVPDTIFARTPPDVAALSAIAEPLAGADPTRRYVGHYLGTPPQAEALAVTDPARGRAPAGMDIAILAYSGISVKMLVDRTLGADHLTMFTVDYEVGGAAQAHDHPFEECYFFLSGTVQAELDGRPFTFGSGDVVFAGVGSVHGFWNDGPDRVRWLETQAPQPPARNAYRWQPTWHAAAERGIEPWP